MPEGDSDAIDVAVSLPVGVCDCKDVEVGFRVLAAEFEADSDPVPVPVRETVAVLVEERERGDCEDIPVDVLAAEFEAASDPVPVPARETEAVLETEGKTRAVLVAEREEVTVVVPEREKMAEDVAVREPVAVPENETADPVQGQQPVPAAAVTGRERRQVGGSVRVFKLPLVQLYASCALTVETQALPLRVAGEAQRGKMKELEAGQ